MFGWILFAVILALLVGFVLGVTVEYQRRPGGRVEVIEALRREMNAAKFDAVVANGQLQAAKAGEKVMAAVTNELILQNERFKSQQPPCCAECYHHQTHPCEKCGRINGYPPSVWLNLTAGKEKKGEGETAECGQVDPAEAQGRGGANRGRDARDTNNQ